MISIDLQLLGGRGASAFRRQTERLLQDLLAKRRGKIKEINAAAYGGLKAAESEIRGLKKERLLVYEDIAVSPTAGYQGNEDSVSFDPMRTSRTSTVTHNHPDPLFGGTFSFADMGNATTLNWRSHRAAAKEGTYYLKPRSNAKPLAYNARIARDVPRLREQMRREARKIEGRVKRGEITWDQAKRMNRTVQVGVLHRYYKNTAKQYGYDYGLQKLNKTRR